MILLGVVPDAGAPPPFGGAADSRPATPVDVVPLYVVRINLWDDFSERNSYCAPLLPEHSSFPSQLVVDLVSPQLVVDISTI